MAVLAEFWQWIVVGVVEILALGFLAQKLFGRVAPRAKRGPDVPVSALLRKKRP